MPRYTTVYYAVINKLFANDLSSLSVLKEYGKK